MNFKKKYDLNYNETWFAFYRNMLCILKSCWIIFENSNCFTFDFMILFCYVFCTWTFNI